LKNIKSNFYFKTLLKKKIEMLEGA